MNNMSVEIEQLLFRMGFKGEHVAKIPYVQGLRFGIQPWELVLDTVNGMQRLTFNSTRGFDVNPKKLIFPFSYQFKPRKGAAYSGWLASGIIRKWTTHEGKERWAHAYYFFPENLNQLSLEEYTPEKNASGLLYPERVTFYETVQLNEKGEQRMEFRGWTKHGKVVIVEQGVTVPINKNIQVIGYERWNRFLVVTDVEEKSTQVTRPQTATQFRHEGKLYDWRTVLNLAPQVERVTGDNVERAYKALHQLQVNNPLKGQLHLLAAALGCETEELTEGMKAEAKSQGDFLAKEELLNAARSAALSFIERRDGKRVIEQQPAPLPEATVTKVTVDALPLPPQTPEPPVVEKVQKKTRVTRPKTPATNGAEAPATALPVAEQPTTPKKKQVVN